MSSSKYCFLTCIQISQKAGQVVWYSHLLKNFPQFVVIHRVKGFGIVNEAEVDVYLREGNGTPLQYSSAWKIPWTEEPGRIQSMGSLRVGLSDFTFTFHFRALEMEMANHSTVFAWRIPGTGEPGGLPSMGSHRVGHDWSGLAAAADVFLELPCFFDDPTDAGNLISGSSAFSKSSLNIRKFMVHILFEAWLGEFWALLWLACEMSAIVR